MPLLISLFRPLYLSLNGPFARVLYLGLGIIVSVSISLSLSLCFSLSLGLWLPTHAAANTPVIQEEGTENTKTAADSPHVIHVLGAVEEQGPIHFSNSELQAPLAEIITKSISEAGGFKDYAKSNRIYVYFKTGDQQDGFDYNAQCSFRFNTHATQKDNDCHLAAERPSQIYRLFVKGNKRKSLWSYMTDSLKLFGAIAVPVILASDN